jgi:hypothetical protein
VFSIVVDTEEYSVVRAGSHPVVGEDLVRTPLFIHKV